MASATQKQKLTNLDTKGVAVVTSGANGKRFALAKSKLGADPTFEQVLAEVLKSGDMPLDEKAIEDMCMSAGLDAQATETFKAVMKLAHVYRDNAAFNGMLKQQFAKPGGGEQPQPGTPGAQPQPGQQPGQVQPGKPQPGAQADPAAQQAQPGAGGNPFKPEGKGEDTGEGYPAGEEQETKPPFAGADEQEEPEMDPEKEKELKKQAEDAVKKAADAEAQIVALKKANEDLKTQVDGQKTAVEAATAGLKQIQDEMKKAAWISKAEKELAYVPGKNAAELGEMLFKIEALDAAQAKSTFELLKQQSDVMKTSGLFRQSGVGGTAPAGTGSAWEEIEKLVADLVAKSDRKEDAEVARARAMHSITKSHPALYKRYCEEQKDTNARVRN